MQVRKPVPVCRSRKTHLKSIRPPGSGEDTPLPELFNSISFALLSRRCDACIDGSLPIRIDVSNVRASLWDLSAREGQKLLTSGYQ